MPDPGPPPSPADPGPPARLPWELHPALSGERLTACARLLARGRADALALADPWAGDDAWSVGCRAYSFSRNRLRRAAEGGRWPWLGVLDETLAFVFLIDGVPVRFYRGDAEDPTARTLRRQEAEARQLALALGAADADGLAFRLAVETGPDGGVTRVVFLALRGEEGRAECSWPVPLDGEDVAEAPPARRNAGGVLPLPLAAGSAAAAPAPGRGGRRGRIAPQAPPGGGT